MKRIIIALCAIIATYSAVPFRLAQSPLPEARPCALTIYEVASIITGAPADIIEGIAWAESSCGRNIRHPDPLDVGYFGLHESPAYHDERAKKWGDYDARNPQQAAIITGRLYMENLARLDGDERKAISAHYQGVGGVRRNGICEWYVDRVLMGGNRV